MRKKNNGITLIALVITIIVLLILAGISIGMLTGENGILTKATQASEKYKIETAREKIQLAVQSYEMDKENTTLYEELSKVEGLSYISPNGEHKNEGPPYTIIVDGYEFIVQNREGTKALEVIYKGEVTEKKEIPEVKIDYDQEKIENLTITITATTKDEEGLKQIIVSKKRVEGETIKYDVIAEENVAGKETTINVAIPANGQYVIQVVGQNDMVGQEEITIDNIVNATIVATISGGEVIDNHVAITVRGKNTEIPIETMELYVEGQKVKTYKYEEKPMEKEEIYVLENMEFYKSISCYVKIFNTRGKEANSTTVTTVNNKTIATLTDLKNLARQVNEGNSFKYHTIYLVSDITTGETWEPIGYWNGEIGTPSGKYFSGVFEGNQHTITIPSITQDTDSYKSSGLFGNIKEATIQDLTIKGNLVNKDCGYIGSISGISYDSIITNCLNRANVKGYFGTGGIVGAVEAGNINNCQNTGTISSTKEMPSDWKDPCAGYAVAGGIVGTQIGGLVEKCYNFGIVNSENINKSLLGGISGYSQANIQYCGNEENITWSGNINRKYLYGRNCWMCVRRSRYLSIL